MPPRSSGPARDLVPILLVVAFLVWSVALVFWGERRVQGLVTSARTVSDVQDLEIEMRELEGIACGVAQPAPGVTRLDAWERHAEVVLARLDAFGDSLTEDDVERRNSIERLREAVRKCGEIEVRLQDVKDGSKEAKTIGRELLAQIIVTQDALESLRRAGQSELAEASSDVKPLWDDLVLTIVVACLVAVLTLTFIRRTKRGEDAVEASRLELENTEEALRRSESDYRALFEETKNGVFVSTPEGGVIDVNAAVVDLLGYESREEMLALPNVSVLWVDPTARDAYRRRIAEAGFLKDYELRLLRKDGTPITVLETVSVVRDGDGRITAYRGIMHDVTEKRRLEHQLQQAQKMETIGTLAGGIAHDFNNLLTIVLGNVEFLLNEREADAQRRGLEEIDAAGREARRLTDQLLSLGRARELELQALDLHEVIRDVGKLLRGVVGRDVGLVLDVDEEPAFIRADSTSLHQVLTNLVSNARDAMRDGGTVTITTRRRPEIARLELTVTDTGDGIDREVQRRIFEPFFTTKERGKGTGLGLWVVYGIVKQHGGDIEVESVPGSGTTFRLSFPLLPSTTKTPTEPVRAVGGRERILVVEDEAIVREVAVRALRGLGYDVVAVGGGREAVRVMTETSPGIDAILMDVVMPGLTGPAAYDLIRRVKSVPVLFVTGCDLNSEIDHLRRPGLPVAVLPKPYTSNDLGRALRELLDVQAEGGSDHAAGA